MDGEKIIRGAPQAALQVFLLLLQTALVSIFYDRGHPADVSLASLECWSVTPVHCEECLNSTHHAGHEHCPFEAQLRGYYFYTHQGPTTLCDLVGQAPEYERPLVRSDTLFAAVGVPYLLLVAQVVAAVFFIGYIRYDSHDDSHESGSNLQKTMKRIALVVELVYAGCFLFIQNTWKIPGNNLLLGEILLLASLFYISFHPSSHYSEHARRKYTPTRYLEFALTLPLLSVAAAGAVGLADAVDLGWIFFTSVGATLFLLCVEVHNRKSGEGTAVLLLNAWLCEVGFILEYSVALQRAAEMQQRPWAVAGAALVLAYHLAYLLIVSVYHAAYTQEDHHRLIFLLDWLAVVGKYAVTLCLMLGAVLALDPK